MNGGDKSLIEYKKMYWILFNAITDAIKLLQATKQGKVMPVAIELLQQAQQKTEEIYISSEKPNNNREKNILIFRTLI